jgi:hypothetical protein
VERARAAEPLTYARVFLGIQVPAYEIFSFLLINTQVGNPWLPRPGVLLLLAGDSLVSMSRSRLATFNMQHPLADFLTSSTIFGTFLQYARNWSALKSRLCCSATSRLCVWRDIEKYINTTPSLMVSVISSTLTSQLLFVHIT